MKIRPLGYVAVGLLICIGLLSCGRTPAEQATVGTDPAGETSVVILIPEDPPSFNGAITDTGIDTLVMELVLLGLTDIDPDSNVFAELAVELPTIENGGVVIDEDGQTMDVTWRLREDARWSDGTPLTADDVLFTWEAINDPEGGAWVPGKDYTDSLEKVDDHTFVVHYNAIYPGYLTQFGGEMMAIWPKHYCDASQGFSAWECAHQPLSSGPYVLEEWAAGDHMTFVRNPEYFGQGKPYIDKVILRVVPDEAVRKTMLVKGDGDVTFWMQKTQADELQSESGVRVDRSPNDRWAFRLMLNLAAKGSTDPAEPHPILADVRVRQAIRMAVDVEAITSDLFADYSTIVWTELYRPPYACDVPKPTFDPQQAAALLEEAGWTDQDGDGVRECHGCLYGSEGDLMQVELIIYAEYGELLELTQQLIAEMLQEIGFGVQLTVVEGSVLWADYESGGIEQQGNFDIDLWDDGYAGVDPADYLMQYYASASAIPDNGLNIGRWQNAEFDALLDELNTLDEAKRQEVFCQMAQILDQELPSIMLFSAPDVSAYNTRLEGVKTSVNDLITWNVADWKVVE